MGIISFVAFPRISLIISALVYWPKLTIFGLVEPGEDLMVSLEMSILCSVYNIMLWSHWIK